MKCKTCLLLFFCLAVSSGAFSQIQLKSEYIGRSRYYDADNNKTDGKGDAKVYSAAFQAPLSVKLHEDKRVTAWALSLSGSYTDLDNRSLSRELCPEKIANTRLGLLYLRPFKEKWSVMASLGGGVYASHTRLSKITFDEVLFDGAFVFLWHLRPNLDLGFGVAVNNSFGFPMGFPAIVLQWQLEGRYEVRVQMMNAASVSAGMNLTERFKLSLVFEADGAMALEKRDGKKMMFSHSYMISGLRPEIKIGKHLSIPVTAGVMAERAAYYERCTLKAFFKAMDREYDPRFKVAPYVSAALRIGF